MFIKRLLLPIAKVTVTVTLLYAVAQSVDLRALGDALSKLDTYSVLIAACLILLHTLILGWRWHRIIRHLGGALPTKLALYWTLVGIFFNQALPSSVGGDAVRVWMLHRQGQQQGLALGSVLVERVSGLVMLGMLVSLSSALLLYQGQGETALVPLLCVGPALLAGTAALLGLGELLSTLLPQRLGTQVRLLGRAFSSIWRKPIAAIEAMLLGAAASGIGLLAAWVLGRSLGVDAAPHVYVALMGGALLLAVLPFSVGGWGLREASVVALFTSFGIPREPILAMSLVWALLPVLISAPFAMAWWLARRPTEHLGPDQR